MEELQEKVAGYITLLFKEHANPNLVYHNLSHTLQVVSRTLEIGQHYYLSSLEKFIITTAAWFHDIGHLFGEIREHEQKSVDMMRAFLDANGCDRNIINQIAACILVTKFPSNPIGLTQQILCDADTYHLGSNEFPEWDEKVKKEMLLREGVQTDEWDLHTLVFLRRHQYFTTYCRELLNQGKLKNIETLQSRIANHDK